MKRLKANELRIGNYVWHHKSQYQITNISAGYPMFNIGESVSLNYDPFISILEISPIVLTCNRSLKFGFQKLSSNFTILRKGQMSIDLYFSKTGVSVFSHERKSDIKMSPLKFLQRERKIKYIHQLQNLLFAIYDIEI